MSKQHSRPKTNGNISLWRKKRDNSSQSSQVWISSTATHYCTQASGKILLASMTLWYETTFFVRHHRQLSRKKNVRFFFNSCPLPLHTYFMVDKAKNICSFVDQHKEISFVCFAELFRLVPNHHFWGITIIWKRRGSRRGCLVDLSVAINFDEVFKYVMQGHSLPSSKYFWAVVAFVRSVAQQKCSVDPSQPIRTLTVFTKFFYVYLTL